ncbi:MAG: hypothetical protein K0Q59_1292 [Paenibacillus sp.]|jgi:diguanylate cyclase (GGDEF)-like protein|nr:hypothetical protein [Paenibacillus sp.]
MFVFYYATMMTLNLTDWQLGRWGIPAVQTVMAVAFLMINRAIYQLYNSTTRRHYLLFRLSLIVAVLLAVAQAFLPVMLEGSPEQMNMFGKIITDLYVLLAAFAFIVSMPGKIGQSGTYTTGLIIFCLFHLCYMINQYVLDSPAAALTFLELYLPCVYYFILFVLLFARTVELMQASYRTSITDGLTGLYNRRYMVSKATQYLQHGYSVALLFSDIDNFKKLNDTFGHDAGDEALKAVAAILQEVSEPYGFAGRFGGEEMVVLVTDPAADMGKFCENVRARIEAEAGVTVSIGYCSSHAGITAEKLISQADEAMYKAKTTGKNKVVKYSRSRKLQEGVST